MIDDLFGGLVDAAADESHVRIAHRLTGPTGIVENWRVSVRALSWTMQIWWPPGVAISHERMCPVLLTGDACWPHVVDDAARAAVLARGVAFASFNRLDVAFDSPLSQREGPIYDANVASRSVGALACWAWALHRCVDALQLIKCGRIAVIGHSRGGKAALLAGATDARIAVTVAHNSGTGGGASFASAHQTATSETLEALATRFPHWLGANVADPAVAARIVDADMPSLLRRIAPRGLMLMQAQDDHWANPDGTRHTHAVLRPAWSDVPTALVLRERAGGGHPMTGGDWDAAAEFVQKFQHHHQK